MSRQIEKIEMTDILESCPAQYVHTITLCSGDRVNHVTNDKSVWAKFIHPEDRRLIREYNEKWEKIEDDDWKGAQQAFDQGQPLIREIKVTGTKDSFPPSYEHTMYLLDGTHRKYSVYKEQEMLAEFQHPNDIQLIKEYNQHAKAQRARDREAFNRINAIRERSQPNDASAFALGVNIWNARND